MSSAVVQVARLTSSGRLDRYFKYLPAILVSESFLSTMLVNIASYTEKRTIITFSELRLAADENVKGWITKYIEQLKVRIEHEKVEEEREV